MNMITSPASGRGRRIGLCLSVAGVFGAAGAAFGAGETARPAVLRRITSVDLSRALGAPSAARSTAPGAAMDASAPSVAVLGIDADGYAALNRQTRATLDLPIEADGSIALELTRFDVFTPDAKIMVVDESGEHEAARPDVQLWRGTVAGDADSRVFLGITAGGAQGYVVSGDKTYSVSTVPGTAGSVLAGQTVVAEAHAMREAQAAVRAQSPTPQADAGTAAWSCAAITPPGALPITPNMGAAAMEVRDSAADSVTCRAIRVAIDSDNELAARFGNDAAKATAYLTQLMGAVSSIYQRDVGSQVQVPFMRVWTASDPWTGTNPSAALSEFQAYFNSNRPTVAYDTAHQINGRGLGGGVAYLGVLCNQSYGYGVSGNVSGSFPFPVQDNSNSNWDLNVVAHELGHNFGTGHTHDPTSYNPPIDGCGNAYLSPAKPQDCTVAQQRNGTIMSYCHICPGGEANLKMTFGPRPSQVIRDYLAGSASRCGIVGGTVSTPTLGATSSNICRGGSVTFTAGNATGATFTWYHNGTAVTGQTGSQLTISKAKAADAGAYWVTAFSGCGSGTSATMNLGVCTGDFNCSGGTTVQDVFDYLTPYFAGSTTADVDGSGSTTLQDLFDFLAAWYAGC